MGRAKVLRDPEAMRAVATIFTAQEMDEILERLKDNGDDFFAVAVGALATEAMFSPARARTTEAITPDDLLTHPMILNELCHALALDEASEEEMAALLSRNAFAIQKIFDRAESCRKEIIKKISINDDALFSLVILRLMALMLANVEQIGADLDEDPPATDKDKLPN